MNVIMTRTSISDTLVHTAQGTMQTDGLLIITDNMLVITEVVCELAILSSRKRKCSHLFHLSYNLREATVVVGSLSISIHLCTLVSFLNKHYLHPVRWPADIVGVNAAAVLFALCVSDSLEEHLSPLDCNSVISTQTQIYLMIGGYAGHHDH